MTRRKFTFVIVANTAALLVLFLGGELYFRISGNYVDLMLMTELRQRPNPMRRWAMEDAYCAYRARPGDYLTRGDTRKTANEHGFLSTPAINPDKPQGAIRIVFLGGSSTAGTGMILADEDTWPWQTMERLRRRLPDAKLEFINAALGGYKSFDSFGRLWSRLRFFSPDIVVVYHGWNEMYYFNADRIKNMHAFRTLDDGSWSLDRSNVTYRVYNPLRVDRWIRWSQLFSHLRLRLSRPVEGEIGDGRKQRPDSSLPGTWDHGGVEIWRTNIRLMRETAKVIDADLFVAKQATLIAPDLTSELRQLCRTDYHGFNFDAHLDAFEQIYRVIEEEIPPDRVIDTRELSGRPEYFVDHIHPTVEGAARLADLMANALEPRIRALDKP